MLGMEALMRQATDAGIVVFTDVLTAVDLLDGLYLAWPDTGMYAILLNVHRPQATQQATMAEELGHHYRTSGTIIRQDTVSARKAEGYGRQWAYDTLLPASELVSALRSGDCTLWQLCDRFSLPVAFVRGALDYHARKQNIRGLDRITCHWCTAI